MLTIALYENRDTAPRLKSLDDPKKVMTVEEEFLGIMESDSEETSPWKNRIVLDDKYCIIPEKLHHKNDIGLATSKRFVVVKFGPDRSCNSDKALFAKITEEDVKSINEAIAHAMLPEEIKKYKKNMFYRKMLHINFEQYISIIKKRKQKRG